jgi:hypothetical protein
MNGLMANGRVGINEKAVNSFQKEFRTATDVSWYSGSTYVKVSFTFNEQALTAFYNEEGERLAITRNLKSTELPMGLLEELKQSFANYWITDLFEYHGKEEAAYYITIENADHKITLKSLGMCDWIHFRRFEKK